MKSVAILLILCVAAVNSQYLVKPLKDSAAIMTCVEDCLSLCKDGLDAIKNKDYTKLPVIMEEAVKTFTDCKAAAAGGLLEQVKQVKMTQACTDDVNAVVSILKDFVAKGMSWNCGMDCVQEHVTSLQQVALKAKSDCSPF